MWQQGQRWAQLGQTLMGSILLGQNVWTKIQEPQFQGQHFRCKNFRGQKCGQHSLYLTRGKADMSVYIKVVTFWQFACRSCWPLESVAHDTCYMLHAPWYMLHKILTILTICIQIMLTRGVGGSLMCGGSIVGSNKVITAGHCCDGWELFLSLVIVIF